MKPLTWPKKAKCTIIVIFINVAEYVRLLSADLLIRAKNDNLKPERSRYYKRQRHARCTKESGPSVAHSDTKRVPLCRLLFGAIAAERGRNGRGSGKGRGHSKMDTG